MTHLLDRHKIRRKDGGFQKYLFEHFETLLCCCGCGQKVQLAKRDFKFAMFAPNCDGLKHSRNPSRIEFYLYLGLNVDEAITVFRDHKSKIAKKYSTEELRKRLSEKNSGAKNPASYKSIRKRTGRSKEEIKRELNNKSAGENNGFYNRGHTDETKKKASIKSAKARANQSRIVTKPEIAIWAFLHALGIEFDYECFIDEYVVDFLIKPNIIIEVYGDYWHSDRMCSYDKPAKDKTRVDFLRSLGYVVHVFWESEIMKIPKETFHRLKKIIDEN